MSMSNPDYYSLYQKYKNKYQNLRYGGSSERLSRLSDIERISDQYRQNQGVDCGKISRKKSCNRTSGCHWDDSQSPPCQSNTTDSHPQVDSHDSTPPQPPIRNMYKYLLPNESKFPYPDANCDTILEFFTNRT